MSEYEYENEIEIDDYQTHESEPEETRGSAHESSSSSESEHENEQEHHDQQDYSAEEYQVYRKRESSSSSSEDEGEAATPSVMGGMRGSMFGKKHSSSSSGHSSPKKDWLGSLKSGMKNLNMKNKLDHATSTEEHRTVGQHAPYPQPGQCGQAQQSGVRTWNEHQDFEYSRCTGNRRAVLVGINYFNQKGQLNGCINDVHNVTRFLQSRGYQDITILTDDTNDPQLMPTRDNIIRHMQQLVQGAQRDDALFFHYSGHGVQQSGGDHTEADGLMEAICPVDYERAGLLVDRDSDYNILVKPLPAGCRLTSVFDSCHSGTVMNLPYIYSTHGTVKEPNLALDTGKGLLRAAPQYFAGDTMGAAKSLFGAAMSSFKESKANDALRDQNTHQADAILFSGCKDEQTSADTTEEGQATGAMSYALIRALNSDSDVTYKELLNRVRQAMIAGSYAQKPQLSSCHPIDTNLTFIV